MLFSFKYEHIDTLHKDLYKDALHQKVLHHRVIHRMTSYTEFIQV